MHAAFKVSHHASVNGLHPLLHGATSPDRSRLWMATPYNKNGGLPNFGSDGGPANILQHLNELHLTALPFKHEAPNISPLRRTRKQLDDREFPGEVLEDLPGGVRLDVIAAPDEQTGLDAWICAGFQASGEIVSLEHGPFAVVVTEGG